MVDLARRRDGAAAAGAGPGVHLSGIDDAQALAVAATAFDGVAVAEEPVPLPPPCALPAPRAAAPGCLALTAWDRRTCGPLAATGVQVTAADGTPTAALTDAAGQVDACGLAGRNQVVLVVENGPPRWTSRSARRARRR